ncbi:MAG: TolC family protein [Elusimicrobia bacterium]|nr:TolC family protein [Elusimicrobiota bacterium]
MNALLLVLAVLGPCRLCAEPAQLRIGLDAALEAAQHNSALLQAVEADRQAAQKRASSRQSLLWPRLTMDASYKYISEVPALAVAGRTQALGANDNYSLGPTLSWTLWDQGVLREAWRSAQAVSRARDADLKATGLQVRLKLRLAYAQAQLALEAVRSLGDSLRLAQSQHADIAKRLHAGAASRTDSLSAHQDVLGRRRQYRQARADLAGALRELYALIGEEPAADLSLPLDASAAAGLPADVEPPSVTVALDLPEDSMQSLAAAEGWPQDLAPPALSAWTAQADSSRLAARSLRAGLWPTLQLSARTSADYPNGPVLETINQNTVGVFASLPLFENGRTRRQAAELEAQARDGDWRREAARRDLARDWLKAKDQLAGLKAQREINRQAASEAHELSRLTYESYKAGRATYIEVQSANLRELEARVQCARTDTQLVMQLAILASLSEKE